MIRSGKGLSLVSSLFYSLVSMAQVCQLLLPFHPGKTKNVVLLQMYHVMRCLRIQYRQGDRDARTQTRRGSDYVGYDHCYATQSLGTKPSSSPFCLRCKLRKRLFSREPLVPWLS